MIVVVIDTYNFESNISEHIIDLVMHMCVCVISKTHDVVLDANCPMIRIVLAANIFNLPYAILLPSKSRGQLLVCYSRNGSR